MFFLIADCYIQHYLADHVVPFALFVGEYFLSMQNNAGPYVARAVIEYLDEVDIQRLERPPRSTDLNPMEHVWDMLGKRFLIRRSETLSGLRKALIKQWKNIQETIKNLLKDATPHGKTDKNMSFVVFGCFGYFVFWLIDKTPF